MIIQIPKSYYYTHAPSRATSALRIIYSRPIEVSVSITTDDVSHIIRSRVGSKKNSLWNFYYENATILGSF